MKYAITMSFVGGYTFSKIWDSEQERNNFAVRLSTANWKKDKIITNKCGINMKHLCYYYLQEIEENKNV